MAIIIYDSGTNDSSGTESWSNVANAFDGTSTTVASCSLGNEDISDKLIGTANDNIETSKAIRSVYLYAEFTSSDDISLNKCIMQPIFDGTTAGDEYETGIDEEDYEGSNRLLVNITNDSEAPGTWTWTAINNLDMNIYFTAWDLGSTNIDLSIMGIFVIHHDYGIEVFDSSGNTKFDTTMRLMRHVGVEEEDESGATVGPFDLGYADSVSNQDFMVINVGDGDNHMPYSIGSTQQGQTDGRSWISFGTSTTGIFFDGVNPFAPGNTTFTVIGR